MTAVVLGIVAALSGCATTSTLPESSPTASPTASIPGPGVSTIPAPAGVALLIVSGPAKSRPSLPWSLIRVNRADSRIYLSATGPGRDCTTPVGAHVDETTQTVTIRVVGRSAHGPCTAQKLTMIGYVVTKAPIGTARSNTPTLTNSLGRGRKRNLLRTNC